MYGGLFGDLPATKKSKTTNSKDDEDDAKKSASGSIASSSSSGKTATAGSSAMLTPSTTSSHLAPTKIKSKKAPVSLVQKIGSAGTSMAFVPTSIKKKSNVTVRQSSNPSQPGPTEVKMEGTKTSTESNSLFVAAKPSTNSALSSTSRQHHGVSDWNPAEPMDGDDGENVHPDSQVHEPDDIRKRHESVLDPYDPYVPNDLLEYWERQSLAEERRLMEKEARERLEQQQALRQELARQEHQNEGLSSTSLASQKHPTPIPAVGRGRGGISNLPAWMIRQQQQQQESKDGPTGQP